NEVKISICIEPEQVPPDLMSYIFQIVRIEKASESEESVNRLEFYKGMHSALLTLAEKMEQEIASYHNKEGEDDDNGGN
ncbi:MAG: hypothetical protein D6726_07905, partial [Nitrospirae bacterium]